MVRSFSKVTGVMFFFLPNSEMQGTIGTDNWHIQTVQIALTVSRLMQHGRCCAYYVRRHGDTQDLQFLEAFAIHRWALGFAAVCVYNMLCYLVCMCV